MAHQAQNGNMVKGGKRISFAAKTYSKANRNQIIGITLLLSNCPAAKKGRGAYISVLVMIAVDYFFLCLKKELNSSLNTRIFHYGRPRSSVAEIEQTCEGLVINSSRLICT